MELDELDVRILLALTEDARRSLRDVAGLVGSTPTTVSARFERLKTVGLVEGADLRFDAERLPGASRLVTGRVPATHVEGVLAAARETAGVIEAAVAGDGHLVVLLQVRSLEEEDEVVSRLSAAGAEGLAAASIRRASGPPPRHLFGAAAVVTEPCAVCGRGVGADPVVETVDARRVVFCCTSCRRAYLDRYARLKEGAAGAGPSGRA